jgi:hypothetical protein
MHEGIYHTRIRFSHRTTVMPRATARRLGLADLMILVAATAAGLAGSRMNSGLYSVINPNALYQRFHELMVEMIPPCAIAWGLALIIIGLRHERPRRLFRRPGIAACVGAAVVWGLRSIDQLTSYARYPAIPLDDVFLGDPFEIGFGVAVAWTLLVLTGRCRCEGNGINMLGVGLGCYWLALWFALHFALI